MLRDTNLSYSSNNEKDIKRLHCNVVRSSHRKIKNKHIDIYFFTVPIYHRSVMTGSYKKIKLKSDLFCHKVFEKRDVYLG